MIRCLLLWYLLDFLIRMIAERQAAVVATAAVTPAGAIAIDVLLNSDLTRPA
jgi:hypothetical protein